MPDESASKAQLTRREVVIRALTLSGAATLLGSPTLQRAFAARASGDGTAGATSFIRTSI